MWDDPAIAAVLTPGSLALLWLGTFVGAVASGGAGFAFALAASSLWLHVLDPLHTTLLVLLCSTPLQFVTGWSLRHHVKIGRVWPFVAGGLVGIPIGVQLLTLSNPAMLKAGLGVLLAGFGLYVLLVRQLPRITGGGRVADAAVGFSGGLLGGLAGYSGLTPTIWTQLRGWNKSEARAVYQPFIIAMQIASLLLLGTLAFDRLSAVLLLLVLPPLIAGGWLGFVLYGRLDDRRFRQMIAMLLVVSGLTLVF